MNKPKFKTGDKVVILDGSNIDRYTGGWNMSEFVGKAVTIKAFKEYSGPDRIGYYVEEIAGYIFDERGLELVSNQSIKKVIHNKPATVVIWADDSKTVVKCDPRDTYDEEKGLAMCIAKKFLSSKEYHEVFKVYNEDPKHKEVKDEVSVQEMRKALDDYCSIRSCDKCPLKGSVCKRGLGFYFTRPKGDNAYMTDDEIKEAYKLLFKNKEDK